MWLINYSYLKGVAGYNLLFLKLDGKEEFLINLIDSLGHVDFSSEVIINERVWFD